MNAVWITIAGLTVATAAIKAAGPVLAGGRELPPRALAVVALFAPALLAALVVVQTLSEDGVLILRDARVAGVAVAAGALALRAPVLISIALAVVTTAGLRALG